MAPRDTLVRLAQQGAALGHVIEVGERVPGRKGSWQSKCSCGWKSSDRRTQAVALGAGFHHLGLVAGAASRNGRQLPEPLRDTPKITNS